MTVEPIDSVFRALSDPTRRQVLERLSRSPASVSELAAPFPIALPSFLQHMTVLGGSGLVRSKKKAPSTDLPNRSPCAAISAF